MPFHRKNGDSGEGGEGVGSILSCREKRNTPPRIKNTPPRIWKTPSRFKQNIKAFSIKHLVLSANACVKEVNG